MRKLLKQVFYILNFSLFFLFSKNIFSDSENISLIQKVNRVHSIRLPSQARVVWMEYQVVDFGSFDCPRASTARTTLVDFDFLKPDAQGIVHLPCRYAFLSLGVMRYFYAVAFVYGPGIKPFTFSTAKKGEKSLWDEDSLNAYVHDQLAAKVFSPCDADSLLLMDFQVPAAFEKKNQEVISDMIVFTAERLMDPGIFESYPWKDLSRPEQALKNHETNICETLGSFRKSLEDQLQHLTEKWQQHAEFQNLNSEFLLKELQSKEPARRWIAAIELSKLKETQIISNLIPLLKSNEMDIQKITIALLARREANSKNAIPELLHLLKTGNEEIKLFVVGALGFIGISTKETVNAVVDLLKNSSDKKMKFYCISALARMKPIMPEALSSLIELAAGSDPDVQAASIEALGSLGADAVSAIPILEELLKKKQETARVIRTLGLIGPSALKVVSTMVRALGPWDYDLEFVLSEAIGRIGKEAIPVMIDEMKGTWNGTKIAVFLGALEYLRAEAKDAIPTLMELLKKPEEYLNKAGVMGLGKVGIPVSEAIPILTEMFEVASPEVKKEIILTLQKMGAEAIESLFKMMEKSGVPLRVLIAEQLTMMQALPSFLQEKLEKFSEDKDFKEVLNKMFREAVADREILRFRSLLKLGADLNASVTLGQPQVSVPQWVTEAGDLEMVQALIKAGADVNIKVNTGQSWLVLAVRHRKFEIVKALVAAGADVNMRSAGYDPYQKDMTPLFIAVNEGDIQTVQFLLDKGADVNAKDSWGRTTLMQVVPNASVELVQLLINRGADVNLKDNSGESSLKVARQYHRPEIEALLQKAGSKEE